MEAYSMATMRNLPDSHPIHKLLRPHFRYTMAINTRARKTLINRGGILDQVFAVGGKGMVEFFKRVSCEFSVDWTNIRKNSKERGVDDPEQLPKFYYRDDGLRVFEAIEDYVRDVVDEFYKSDKMVEDDKELKEWVDDIYTNAFPGEETGFSGTQGHGFPKEITTKEELVERCTVIIFTGSAQHSSINFGQYGIYGYVPSAPLTTRREPPTKKGTTYEVLMEILPNKKDSLITLAITKLLSQYSDDEVSLPRTA
jgi:arachidonate 5-lipoxygenase